MLLDKIRLIANNYSLQTSNDTNYHENGSFLFIKHW